MYRTTSPQLTLTEPTFLVPGILPKDDWSYIYRDRIWPLIDENQFKHFCMEEVGAPNISIKLKISLLNFMALEQLTWWQVEYLFMRKQFGIVRIMDIEFDDCAVYSNFTPLLDVLNRMNSEYLCNFNYYIALLK